MSLIRFETTSGRGPSGSLWSNIVDWVKGTLSVAGGCMDANDLFPYSGAVLGSAVQSGGFVLSGDSGSAASVSAVPFGVVAFTASAGTYPVAGYARSCYVDLTDIQQVCTEVYCSRTLGGTGTETTFIGFSDQAPEAVFHSDGTLDGGSGEDSLGLVWGNDEDVDLVSVINSTATILVADLFTGVTGGVAAFHKFGLRVKKETSNNYTIFSSVDGVVKKTQVTSTQITQAAMRPVVVTTISATDAPTITVDWHFTADVTSA